ncbi:hypothetical protein MJO28_016929 [Puccinia striiformis f. sp. tritici]|nr:hypothetical protein MJO28_016929 [Puccinia striiformis f. sp. tritici]
MGDSLSRPDRGPLLISTTEPYRLSVDAYADEFATQWDHYQSLQLTAPCFAPKSKPIIEKHSQAFDSRDTIDYIQIPGKLW